MEIYEVVVRNWFAPQMLIACSDHKDIEKLVAHDKFCTMKPYFTNIMTTTFRTGFLAIDG